MFPHEGLRVEIMFWTFYFLWEKIIYIIHMMNCCHSVFSIDLSIICQMKESSNTEVEFNFQGKNMLLDSAFMSCLLSPFAYNKQSSDTVIGQKIKLLNTIKLIFELNIQL